ncbi:MAG: 2,5-diamino-6-(ribosylamino)-4(3H)-pyrimidinone 5'-phosphate reductase [Candidatus Undinarchaeales archaeon]|jgi:2,5-diamino-6-(ribosylamino)-4(3H)-pyrimidinone 5'-phosphate reductase|nr:2,5-diamino-6-(ribosylamino)-4(3H)-pyrimidinone 5'-phosphate reductase [Candidatus Undinarchaeales archaeon]MDP7492128.1 2,5-diamino-6-(ribosylamino)-4(3H)-pyrimidinone 5'-phosphate reductase [Candidatus Undinarchaeales archaeon]
MSSRPGTSKPEIVLSSAMSLDGRISTRAGDSRISSQDDLVRVHALRARMDAILVGSGTVLADDPCLTTRLVDGPSPLRVVVDGRARTPPGARVLDDGAPTVIYVSRKAPSGRVAALQEKCDVVVLGEEHVDLAAMLDDLDARGVRTAMLEGGGGLNAAMFAAGLVDKVHITVAPFVIGGKDSVPLVGGDGVTSVDDAPHLELENVEVIGAEVLLRYRVQRCD